MKDYDLIEGYISNYFDVSSFQSTHEGSFFVVNDYNHNKFELLIKDLDNIGYIPFMEKHTDSYRIGIAKKQDKGESRIHINIILFVATVATTIFAGYTFAGGNIWDGVAFAVALLSILGVHETAHYFAAKKHNVKSSLPYFVPAPTLIGTFGAVINVKSPIPNKNSLFDLGFSGPIAGIIVTIPVLIIGIYLSKIAPISIDVHDIHTSSHYEYNNVLYVATHTRWIWASNSSNCIRRMGRNNSNSIEPHARCISRWWPYCKVIIHRENSQNHINHRSIRNISSWMDSNGNTHDVNIGTQ